MVDRWMPPPPWTGRRPTRASFRPYVRVNTDRVDLLLAMQAPIRLERLVPHIVALGVGRLVITGANKVGSGVH